MQLAAVTSMATSDGRSGQLFIVASRARMRLYVVTGPSRSRFGLFMRGKDTIDKQAGTRIAAFADLRALLPVRRRPLILLLTGP